MSPTAWCINSLIYAPKIYAILLRPNFGETQNVCLAVGLRTLTLQGLIAQCLGDIEKKIYLPDPPLWRSPGVSSPEV